MPLHFLVCKDSAASWPRPIYGTGSAAAVQVPFTARSMSAPVFALPFWCFFTAVPWQLTACLSVFLWSFHCRFHCLSLSSHPLFAALQGYLTYVYQPYALKLCRYDPLSDTIGGKAGGTDGVDVMFEATANLGDIRAAASEVFGLDGQGKTLVVKHSLCLRQRAIDCLCLRGSKVLVKTLSLSETVGKRLSVTERQRKATCCKIQYLSMVF